MANQFLVNQCLSNQLYPITKLIVTRLCYRFQNMAAPMAATIRASVLQCTPTKQVELVRYKRWIQRSRNRNSRNFDKGLQFDDPVHSSTPPRDYASVHEPQTHFTHTQGPIIACTPGAGKPVSFAPRQNNPTAKHVAACWIVLCGWLE